MAAAGQGALQSSWCSLACLRLPGVESPACSQLQACHCLLAPLPLSLASGDYCAWQHWTDAQLLAPPAAHLHYLLFEFARHPLVVGFLCFPIKFGSILACTTQYKTHALAVVCIGLVTTDDLVLQCAFLVSPQPR